MTARVVLARRASPDWKALADEHAAGSAVAPERYFPFHDQRFDRRIPQFIERWNDLSRISYFACRARLCEIAADNLAGVADATLLDGSQVDAFLRHRRSKELLLFYHDDDDWFRPDLAAATAPIATETIDAAVFPFVRLASKVTTFTAGGRDTADRIGAIEAFRYRYCTNNYGLSRRALSHGADLVEHTDASQAADLLGFIDLHLDHVVSATSKTPCSASWLEHLPDTRDGFEHYVSRYVETLEAIRIPPGLRWIEAPLHDTLALFRQCC